MFYKKIAIFIGDYFWSSVPYDGLNLYIELIDKFDVDLLMFDKDIRLNKKFKGNEKFYFNKENFTKIKNLKTLSSWEDLIKISKDYSLLLSATHIAPKTRYPNNLNSLQCAWAIWDVGGNDALVNCKPDNKDRNFAPNFFFLKGEIWKRWLYEIKNKTNNAKHFAFSTGSPHYDYYLENAPLKFGKIMSKEKFVSKYKLDKNKNFILITPSNPGASKHNDQFTENESVLSFLNHESHQSDYEILLKTYPHDYIFYESQTEYSGIYHRKAADVPQYENIIKNFPNIKIVDSQDHFAAVKFCNKIFNISGSSISWETYFTNSICFSMNFSNKPYFNGYKYLPNIKVPDSDMNYEIFQPQDIFNTVNVNKNSCDGFISKEYSLKNIKNTIEYILEQC